MISPSLTNSHPEQKQMRINNVIRKLIHDPSRTSVRRVGQSTMSNSPLTNGINRQKQMTINNVIRKLSHTPIRTGVPIPVSSKSKTQIMATRRTPGSLRKVVAVSTNKNKNMYSVESMVATKNSKEFTRMRLSSNQIANYLRNFNKLSNNNGSNKLKSLTKKAPVKKAPIKKSPVKKSPVKKSPVKKSPVKKSLVKKSPVKRAPVKKSPVKKVSIKKRLTKVKSNK
jgi:hypothetical protein